MDIITPITPFRVADEAAALRPRAAATFDATPPATMPQSATAARASAGIAFEATVLRTFVEAMLPEEGFGSGTAGHMWRGQMADALAGQLARNGGIGIADTIGKDLK